jgi:hypothetical protein
MQYNSPILKASLALDMKHIIKKFFCDNDYQTLYTLNTHVYKKKIDDLT